MDKCQLDFDHARGVLVQRVDPDFPDHAFEAFCVLLRTAVGSARKHGPLRFLSDNRRNKVFGQVRAEILWRILTEGGSPADRIAILVENSLAKMRSREQAGERALTFASEHAAYTWLGAGRQIAA